MGYIGKRMSVRADEAYMNCERPRSRWSKADILDEIKEHLVLLAKNRPDLKINFNIELLEKAPIKVLQELFLHGTGWHHTYKTYNRTNFYMVDLDKVETLSDEEIKSCREKHKRENMKKAAK